MIHLNDVAVRYRAPEERVGTFKEYAIRLSAAPRALQRFLCPGRN